MFDTFNMCNEKIYSMKKFVGKNMLKNKYDPVMLVADT